MEIGIIWMTSQRILLVRVLSLWILDKTRVESFWGVVGEGEAELQPWQEGFGMLWVDTGGNLPALPEALLPQRDPAAPTGLGRIWDQSRAWDRWDIGDTRAGMSALRSR